MKQYGLFSQDGTEFTITDKSIPRKWENYIWNDSVLCKVDQDGAGGSHYKHPGGLKTGILRGKRKVFVKEKLTGSYWYLPGFSKEESVTYGLGYAVYKNITEELSTEFRITVPQDMKGEAWKVTVTNKSSERKNISLLTHCDLALDGYFTPFGSPRYALRVYHDKALNSVIYMNNDAYCPTYNFNAFLTADTKITSFQTVPEKFYGPGRGDNNPLEVDKGICDCTEYMGSSGGDTVLGVLSFDIQLEPGETKSVQLLVGVFEEEAEVRTYREKYFTDGSIDEELSNYKKSLKDKFSNINIETPDFELNRLINNWAKYNLLLTAKWTRIYSRGFRDVLQDTMGVVSLDKSIARENILTAMSNMYSTGKCRRAWDNVSVSLGNEFYADGPIWIPLTINAYLKETGDFSILEEVCPYCDGGSSTVMEHMLTAVRFLYNDKGAHGLSLIHDGDWCDTAHLLGKKGRGEGVWLTIALYNAMQEILELARYLGDKALEEEMLVKSQELKETVNAYGWDRDWFLIAYNDDERKIGTQEDSEGSLFLNPQSWAVLSGITTPERETSCFKAIDEKLDSEVGPLLLTPPFTQKDKSIGTITGFYPGTIENGSCYCHAASFKIVADCKRGRGQKAYETLRKIMPGGDADIKNPLADCPPFAFTNSRMAPFHPYMPGKHLYSWITGTVSWSWQAVTEWMLGVRRGFNGLEIDPCIPASWESFKVTRIFRGATYNIEFMNPDRVEAGIQEISVNGAKIEGKLLPYAENEVYDVKVLMK